jgi:hypothetical protein
MKTHIQDPSGADQTFASIEMLRLKNPLTLHKTSLVDAKPVAQLSKPYLADVFELFGLDRGHATTGRRSKGRLVLRTHSRDANAIYVPALVVFD